MNVRIAELVDVVAYDRPTDQGVAAYAMQLDTAITAEQDERLRALVKEQALSNEQPLGKIRGVSHMLGGGRTLRKQRFRI